MTFLLLGLVMGGSVDADAMAALALAKAARERHVTKATPAVVATTFRNGSYHSGHLCPQCGREQLSIESGRKYGPHTHRCPYDGTVWQH